MQLYWCSHEHVTDSIYRDRLCGFCCTASRILVRKVPGLSWFCLHRTTLLCVRVCGFFFSSVGDEEKRNQLMLQGVPLQCCQSFLWERSVRDNVTDNKISEQVPSETSPQSCLKGAVSCKLTLFFLSFASCYFFIKNMPVLS